jgi:surface protein
MSSSDGLVLVYTTTSNNNIVNLPSGFNETKLTIDWGDGNFSYANVNNNLSHTYVNPSSYEVRITANLEEGGVPFYNKGIYFTTPPVNQYLTECKSFGNFSYYSVSFQNCEVLTECPPSAPLGAVNMELMFSGCKKFIGKNVATWNMVGIFNIQHMFNGCSLFDTDISAWDISSIEYNYAFIDNTNFSIENYNKLLYNWSRQTLNVSEDSIRFSYESVITLLGNLGVNNITTQSVIPNNYLYVPPVDGETSITCVLHKYNLTNNSYYVLYDTVTSSIVSSIVEYTGNNINFEIDNIESGRELVLWLYKASNGNKTGSPIVKYKPFTTYDSPLILRCNIPESDVGKMISFPILNGSYTIDWGDGTKSESTSSLDTTNINHVFTKSREYTLYATGEFTSFYYNQPYNSSKKNITECINFKYGLTDINFLNCENLTKVPNKLPTNVKNSKNMFSNCEKFNDASITNWDTSNITDMSGMFSGCLKFNQPLSTWNTSNVTDMSYMFNNCEKFNQPLTTWNTSNVTDMSSMFFGCLIFNEPLTTWNTSNVTDMSRMFLNCLSFNQIISYNISNNYWNTSNVTNMDGMFASCVNFTNGGNSTILLCTSNVESMASMFSGCKNFNCQFGYGPNGVWDFQKIKSMSNMFNTCTKFNNGTSTAEISINPLQFGYIGKNNTTGTVELDFMFNNCENFNQRLQAWNTSKVTSMSYMFYGCSKFNQSFDTYWNTSNVTDMVSMFYGCSKFNQDVNTWDTSKVTSMYSMFQGCSEFNSPIRIVNNGTDLFCYRMLYNATAFNSSITVVNSEGDNVRLTSKSNIQDMFYGAVKCNVDIDTITEQSVSVERSGTGVVVVTDSRKWTSPTDGYALFNSVGQVSIGIVASLDNGIRTFTFNPIPGSVIPTTAVMKNIQNVNNTPVYNGNITAYYTGTMYQNITVTSGLVLRPTFNVINFSSPSFNGGLYYARNKLTGELLSVPSRAGVGKLSLRIILKLGYGQKIIQLIRIGLQRALDEEILVGEFTMTVEDPMICFKEGTKILTSTGYVPIEKLKQGQLVKTLNNNYLPVVLIGKTTIYHPATSERIHNQLYKCSRNNYPTLIEDLVLTGKHALLVNQLTTHEKQKTIEIVGDDLMTDNKYKLPSCVDERTTVYERQGNYTIYHLALKNANPHGNYGIFANGLLVESCSTYMMQYRSGMELFTGKMPLLIL